MASHIHLSALHPPSHITKTSPAHIQPRKRSTLTSHAQGRGFGASTASIKKQAPEKKTNDNKGTKNNKENGAEEEEDAIPEAVFNRMLVRVLLCVGLPMGSGVGLLYALGALKQKGVWVAPEWVPFLAILLSFGTSALGIAYGTLSTSWSVENDGSVMGWEQVRKNWPQLWKEENKSEML